MPDKWGFEHLPDRGAIEVRCTEEGCGDGGPLYQWPEHARLRHAAAHKTNRELELARQRAANLREARRLKRLRDRENEKAYGEGVS
jgi:hypothetical protein